MRDYSKVGPKFWIGKTGKAIRKSGQEAVIVALYLMTCPSSNMLGLFYITLGTISHETGLPLEGALKGLARCIEAGFCRYDEDSEIVWVIEMARFQIADRLDPKDNQCKGVQREYNSLPDNPYLSAFFEKYKDAFNLTSRRDGSTLGQAPSKPLRSQEQEQEQEQELVSNPNGLLVASENADDPYPASDVSRKPDCPHKEIIGLYHEILPMCPRIRDWTPARAAHLRARWNEDSTRQNLDYWKRFFEYVSSCDFLVGKGQGRNNGPPFLADLEWMVKQANFTKIREQRYEPRT